MGLLVKQFIDEKQVLIRGLAHPLIFSDATTNQPLQVDLEGNRVVPRRPFQTSQSRPTNTNNNKSTSTTTVTATPSTTANNNEETAALINAASTSFNEMDGLKSLFTKFGAVEVSPGYVLYLCIVYVFVILIKLYPPPFGGFCFNS